ncbi:MAG: C10 family peptidase [Bacteroidetes bacterium]|nr:C10 family peptidase [Bacteroidota bacterium]
MKKNLVVLLFLISGISVSAFAKNVEIQEARVIGKNFFFQRINLSQEILFGSLAIIKEFTEKENGTPFYYIFDFSSKGYIIIAADDAVFPVIGYSFETFSSAENPSPEFTFWMEHYKDQIRDVKERNLQPDAEITAAWTRFSRADSIIPANLKGILDVQPLITDTWDQGYPYNAMCPEDPAGSGGHALTCCVATAMAMIMHYWRYPAMGQGYHCDTPQPPYGPQCASFGRTSYEWNGMTSIISETCDPVALLSWHTGISIDVNYGPDVSVAWEYKVAPALVNYFRYSTTAQYLQKINYSATNWNNLLTGDLNAGMPVEYGGYGTTSIGHVWVCDGYQGTDFFHMNWGWGGIDNGYFYLNNLNPGGDNFNNSQNATFHIQPDPAYYPNYCAGQTIDTAYASGSIEDGSGPVSNYANNANCSWLIGPDDSVQSIKLTFLRFATDPADEVKIYDGPTTASPLLATYSGSSLPPEISSTGNKMLVTFTSNGNGTANGFLAEFHCALNFFCSGTTIFTDPSGHFGDGSGRFDYRNSSTCKWKIMPPDASSVTLTFSDFKTQQDKDVVQIYDLASNTLLATYSGDYATPPGPVTVSSGKMSVYFNTNNSGRDLGWDASYSISVGTKDHQAGQEMKLYPDPADNFITLELPDLAGNPSGFISIFDDTGRELIHKAVQSTTVVTDVSSLSKGIYIVKLVSSDFVASAKFVKN